MSLLNWLFARKAQSDAAGTPQAPASAASATDLQLKQHRQQRREHLYAVVRDAMLRSEVLASHYKFKVLSLDNRSRQFLVMIDMLEELGRSPEQLARIEHMIGSAALQRHDLLIKAVYWRQLSAPAATTAPTAGKPAAVASQRVAVPVAAAPASAPTAAPLPVGNVGAPTPRGRGGAKASDFEPIGQDEVLAFKRAIAATAAAAPVAAASAPVVSGLRNAEAMHGFEDTQLLEPDDSPSPLSSTQFGDL